MGKKTITALKPVLWHNIVITVILALLSHEPLEALALGEPIVAESIMMSVLGLIAIFLVWFGYYKARKNYLKNYNAS
jgi:hypothetical protein